MQDFSGLGLAAPLLLALNKLGYTAPTPIQAQAIPHLMTGRDLVGIAQTGTGKTAAFALPILHHLITHPQQAPRGGARVLVLSPTRELASQIAESFRSLGSEMQLSVQVVFGGVPHGAQIRALQRGLDVLVATPGRLVDHLDAGAAHLGKTEFFVLDEVDQMLDLGFVKSIRRVVGTLPKRRQNLFFSATMPTEIAKLAGELLNDPVQVSVTPVAKTADRVNQQVLFVETHRKRDVLVDLLSDAGMARTIIFTRTKRGADKVTQHLDATGIAAVAIHGNKSQNQRERSLAAFRAGRVRALVATDIAARGIDIDGVTHVVNFDLPEVPEAYVHRIGRTARAGAEGVAISLCDGAERDLLRNIERLTRLNLPTQDRRAAPGSPEAKPPARSATSPRPQQDRRPGPGASRPQERGFGARSAGAPGSNGPSASRPRYNSARPQGERRRGDRDAIQPA
ncbi:DEAD/DEAH box helicase [Methylocella tundrae]|uniref:DEAD/DEAH box helicase n=1 Tax=Methylocella tundrae TaxID=227605 RepID=UPI0030FDFAB3|nr:DEAD/DEAH box helicase [Methylocella tundrae]